MQLRGGCTYWGGCLFGPIFGGGGGGCSGAGGSGGVRGRFGVRPYLTILSVLCVSEIGLVVATKCKWILSALRKDADE